MKKIEEWIEDAQEIMIAGHLRPDGDCVGSCVALYRYIKKIAPQKNVQVYLEKMPENFEFLDTGNEIVQNRVTEQEVDLFIVLDCSSPDRLGEAEKLFDSAKKTICVDHHISNLNFAKKNYVEPTASSTCEVIYDLMNEEVVDEKIAEALYIGIICDSGVFRYSNTSRHTMEIAGKLMEKGIPFWQYIDECFYQRTYIQTQLLGRTLLTSMRLMDGKCIVACITKRMMEFYGAKTEDIVGIIEQLRITKGVEVAILLHEVAEQEYKVSLRSNNYVDVSSIAVYFGGGGHRKAAGFTRQGSVYDVVNNITEHIEKQIESMEKE